MRSRENYETANTLGVGFGRDRGAITRRMKTRRDDVKEDPPKPTMILDMGGGRNGAENVRLGLEIWCGNVSKIP